MNPAATITVCMNVGNFASYCALAPTLALVDEFGAEVRWVALRPAGHPFSAPPGQNDPLAEYKLQRKRARDAWARKEFERDCERLGLDADATPASIDASAANIALQFLADNGGEVRGFLEVAFERGFVGRRALNSLADVRDLVSVPGFEEYAERHADSRLDELEAEMTAAKIYAGPAYIVGEEALIGRQHFPLIRWILSGSEGEPPV